MSGCECRVCGYYHPGEGCVIDDALVRKLVSERDEALAEVERLRKAITDCLDYANGRQYEWGSRAESAFEILENAIDAARESE